MSTAVFSFSDHNYGYSRQLPLPSIGCNKVATSIQFLDPDKNPKWDHEKHAHEFLGNGLYNVEDGYGDIYNNCCEQVDIDYF